jgi:hypothetical protein
MYPWFVVLHLIGLIAFLVSHAVGMWVSFRVRTERDRAVIASMLAMSVQGSKVMYVGLALLGIGGMGAAATADLLLAPWNVASYLVFTAVFVAMSVIAGFYYHPLREGLEGTRKTPRLDDEALAARLKTRRPEVLALIGGSGLAILVWLMSVKPALW